MGRVRIGIVSPPLTSQEKQMRKILIAATAVMLPAAASLFSASAADKLKVGFIYLGPVGDFGWTYQHELARRALVKEFGDRAKPPISKTSARAPMPSAPSNSWCAPATN